MTILEFKGEIIADVPEVDGIIQTTLGRVGLTHHVGSELTRPYVEVALVEAPVLQGAKGLLQRQIHLGGNGSGRQRITPDEQGYLGVNLGRRIRPIPIFSPERFDLPNFAPGRKVRARTVWQSNKE